MNDLSASRTTGPRWLPRIGSPGYHVLLTFVAIFILGPLGGVSAAFMNLSIGFFVGGQVLAGILGSTVTLPYGPEGRHGANYMQTMAASVAALCGMVVLIQAMAWMGLPEPAPWKLMLYIGSIGMLGVGIGMLYTPIVVDRMQLTFPSGLAVANILRALTDPRLLRRSIVKLGGGAAAGFLGGLLSLKAATLAKVGVPAAAIARIDGWGISTSTFGAGMIVGARITIPALVVAMIGQWARPTLVAAGWLRPGDEFRKIGFVIALGTILGAALIDVGLILWQAARTWRERNAAPATETADWKRVNTRWLLFWVLFWAVVVIATGSHLLGQPLWFLAVAVGLTVLFVLVNGISVGISDSNPVSSAFVLTIFILTGLGLKDPGVGLLCGAIMLIACGTGADMQQDRSTGWRLGSSRVLQFRYQMIGIAMGAVLCVVLAKLFLNAYPVLRIDQFAGTTAEGVTRWNSAMTYKFVGALRGITAHDPHVLQALQLGLAIGLITEVLRKMLKHALWYRAFVAGSTRGRVTDFVLDAAVLPSPYASSFGGFVPVLTTYWWVAGGIVGSLWDALEKRTAVASVPGADDLPADMSTTSLVGGGLIAGESLAALGVGIASLLQTVL